MDFKEQQEQELEALEAIYQEHEISVECREYPNIELRIEIQSNQFEEPTENDFDVTLYTKLPSGYPDVIPEFELEGIEDLFTESRIAEVMENLRKVAEDSVGMVMVFTIVSALQDEVHVLVQERKKANDQKQEIAKEAAEAESKKKFEGTIVNPESFRAWKAKFDNERKAHIEKAELEKQAAIAGRLTGRELFLRDATLSLSDVALLGEGAEIEVEIDESLFHNEDLEGLDLDDSDED